MVISELAPLTASSRSGMTPNYESPDDANRDNTYMVTVVATDAGVNGKNKLTAERNVVVMVTNMEENGDCNPVGPAAQGRG